MIDIKKIEEILNKLIGISEFSRFEVKIRKGVETPFGLKIENTDGNFVEVKLYEEIEEIEGFDDILDTPVELIYRSFVIGPDREIYRYNGSDGHASYYKNEGFSGFTDIEAMCIMNIMDLLEEGDN